MMIAKRWTIVALLALFLLVIAAGHLWDRSASAQAPQAGDSVLRYQISAYSSNTPGGVHHGCYIVDTATGKVWHTAVGEQVKTVSAQLP